ncbi:hypothetical protein UFOVP452_41 [uncultured Caudovirales phage]|uniref:Uncharacterized protein n=1 Tax=uncultured Caudovirales phage TaxID=2100421 RepID=A0A6J5M9M7_9CAUD|nr:hypothetical protein UFOVP452_41 [uncultured Caudovirales phage]
MASGARPYVTLADPPAVRRVPARVRTPIVVDLDGRRLALTVEQAAELQLQLAAALLRQRRPG